MNSYVIASLIFTFVESIIFAVVIHKCIGPWQRKVHLAVFLALLSFAVVMVANIFELPHLVKAPIVFLCLAGIVYALYRAPLHIIIFYTVVVYYINVTASLIVGNTFAGIFNQSIMVLAYSSFFMFILSSVIIHLVQIGGAYILVRFRNGHVDNPKSYWYMLDMSLSLSYFLSSLLVDIAPELQTQINPFIILAVTLAFFAVNAIMVLLFARISQFHVRERRTAMVEVMAQRAHERYRQVQESNQEYAHFKHDWNKQLAAIKYMLNQDDVGEALKLMDNVATTIPKAEIQQYTGNSTFDFVIDDAIKQATEHNITIEIKAGEIGEISVDANDIVAAIGNLLENAIEATMQLDVADRHIIFHCARLDNHIVITVQNKYQNAIKLSGDEFVSSKGDTAFRGYGISIVRGICEKYGGALDISYSHGEFRAHATMYLPEKA